MSEAIWEPWRPAVGDRVRVRLSGECPWHELPDDLVPEATGTATSGYEGVVVPFPSDAPRDLPIVAEGGHRIFVEFDTPRDMGDWTLVGAFYAAIELEPLP